MQTAASRESKPLLVEATIPALESLLMRNNAMFQKPRGLASIQLSVNELETASRDLVDSSRLPMKRPSGGVYHTYYEMFKEKGFKVDDLEKEIGALPTQDGMEVGGGMLIQEFSGGGGRERGESSSSVVISGKDKRPRQQQHIPRLHQQQYDAIRNFPYFPDRINQEIMFEAFELAVRVCIEQDDVFEPSLPGVAKLQPLPRAIYKLPYVRGDPSLMAEKGGVWGKLLILVFWRPSYKPSAQAMAVFNTIQERYSHLVHVLGIIEPMYEREVANAGSDAPRHVVTDNGAYVSRELGINLSPSSAGLPSVLMCLPGSTNSLGVRAAGVSSTGDCHKILFATGGRRAISRNTGRALSALLTAFGGNCPDPDQQMDIVRSAKEIEDMSEWSMPFWASREQWAALQNEQAQSAPSAGSFSQEQGKLYIGGGTRDKAPFHSLAARHEPHAEDRTALALSAPPRQQDAIKKRMVSPVTLPYQTEDRGSVTTTGVAREAASVTSAVVDGIMYLLGGDKPRAEAGAEAEAGAAPVPASVSSARASAEVPAYARRGAEYSAEQLNVLQQQRDRLMELRSHSADTHNASIEEPEEVTGNQSSGAMVTTETSELEPEVQAHYEVVQAMLQDCSSFPNAAAATSTPLDPAAMFKQLALTDERLCGGPSGGLGGLRTPGINPGGGLSLPREEYLRSYASMWSLLECMVTSQQSGTDTCKAGQFLPMLHHRLASHRDLRSSGHARRSGLLSTGRRDVYSYEAQSRGLSGGTLHGLQVEELARVCERYGGRATQAVETWVKERAPGRSPERDTHGSLTLTDPRDLSLDGGGGGAGDALTHSASSPLDGPSSSRRDGIDSRTSPGGGILGSMAPRWDFVYCCMRTGLYDAAAKEVSRSAGAASPTGTRTRSGDTGVRRGSGGYRSQTAAGREREKVREAVRKEATFLNHLHRVIEGLSANQPASAGAGVDAEEAKASATRTPGADVGGSGVAAGSIDLTSDAMVASVTGLREYYLSYSDNRQKMQAEQSYDRTHDTHHHHHQHHHHHHHKGATSEEPMEVHKEALVLLLGFYELRSVCDVLRRLCEADGCAVGPELLWAGVWQMHYSRRFLALSSEGYLPLTPYEEELSCCIDPAGLCEEAMRWGLDFAGGVGADGGMDINPGPGDNNLSFGMSPAPSAYKNSYSIASATATPARPTDIVGGNSSPSAGGAFGRARVLLCCQQFSAAVSHLHEAGEVVPAVHLAATLLYYGLLHSQEPLLRTVPSDSGPSGLVPSDQGVSSLLQSYAFPALYPYVSLAYVLMLALPQSYPSLEHMRTDKGGSIGIGTSTALTVAGDAPTTAAPPPLLLEDISEFSFALGTLFEQVGGADSPEVVTELVQAMADLYFSPQGGSGSSRGTLVSVLSIIGQRAMSVHCQLGEALFYFSLAERYSGGSDNAEGVDMEGSSASEAFTEALVAVLQQLSVQLQGLVRPSEGGGEDARKKVRGDASRLLQDLSSLANGTAVDGRGERSHPSSTPMQAALRGADRNSLQQLSRLCCVLCNLETCASFLDLCAEIDRQGLNVSGMSGGSERAALELDVMALVEGRLKPLRWHFVDPSPRDAAPTAGKATRLFSEIVPLPLLLQDETQVQMVHGLLRSQSRGSLGIYADLLQHCVSYLQRLLSYVRQGYGSSFTVESDRRLVEDLLQMRQRMEGVITSF